MKLSLSLALIALLLVGCSLAGQAGMQSGPQTEAPAAIGNKLPSNTSMPAVPTTGTIPSALLAYPGTAYSGYELGPVDPATGQPIPGHSPIQIGHGTVFGMQYEYSGDGRRLALIESRGESCEPFMGGTSCRPTADLLHLIDLEAWQEITATLPGAGWVSTLAFSLDGERLALDYNNAKSSIILLVNPTDGQFVSKTQLDFRPEQIAFTPDGRSLAVYGQPMSDAPGITEPGSPRLVALQAVEGGAFKKLWELELQGVDSGQWCLEGCDASHGQQLFAYYQPGVLFSSAEAKLYILHADGEQMGIVDLATGRIDTVPIGAPQSWIERLLSLTAGVAQAKGGMRGATEHAVLSPDGSKLYTIATTWDAELNQDGFWESKQTKNEVQVIDLKSRQIIAHEPTQAYTLRIDPTGKYLLLDAWVNTGQSTWVLAADGLSHVNSQLGWQVLPARGMDGKITWLGIRTNETTTDLALLDPQNLQIANSWQVNGQAQWVLPPENH
jgi:hypothetical protein